MSLSDRNTAAWQRGDIDDATFERREVCAAWKVGAVLSGIVALVFAGLGYAKGFPWPQVLLVAGSFALLGVAVGSYLADFARFTARNLVLKRYRQQVEANPATPLVAALGPVGIARFVGVHHRSKGFANRMLLVSMALGVLAAGIFLRYGPSGELAIVALGVCILCCWALFLRLDRRPYLDIAAGGIWCRRWGAERLGFAEFKAVYPRRNGVNVGVTLVPRHPADLKRKLSWLGRLALRSGDFGGVAAHVDTLTIWSNRLDLPRDALLLALQSEVVRR